MTHARRAVRYREARQFWANVPPTALSVLLAAIFCLFSTFGFLGDIRALGRQSPAELALSVLFSGGIAVVYAWLAFRRPKWMPLAVVVHLLIVLTIRRAFPEVPPLAESALRRRLEADMAGTVVGIVFGYVLVVTFVAREGQRYFRVHEEIRLAREIHGMLVPAVAKRVGAYEFFGVSHPSGEVGGDLVDVVETPGGGWLAYVADVSGHGVSAGLLMGMTKSATRMTLATSGTGPFGLGPLLVALNRVLLPLKKPNMFVTFAALQAADGGELRATVAGHLPILRVSGRPAAVEEITLAQVPLGIIDDYAFADMPAPCAGGDLLVVLTDGLTEVFDAQDRELGLDGVKALLAAHAAEPLPSLAARLMAAARAHGAQLDDQTLLLVRKE